MIDYPLIESLLAIKEAGSFEGAASFLGMSKSAISQKIKLLDQRLGEPTINRNPVAPTLFGKRLCSHLQQVRLLEAQLILKNGNMFSEVHADVPSIAVTIRRDIQTRCFFDYLENILMDNPPFLLDVTAINKNSVLSQLEQEYSIAAICSDNRDLKEYQRYELGKIRFRAVASPDILKSHFSAGLTPQSVKNVTALTYSDDDELLMRLQQRHFGRLVNPATFSLPSIHGLIKKCIKGAGWSILPEHNIQKELAEGQLCDLCEDAALELPLFWYISSDINEEFFDITKIILAAAETMRLEISSHLSGS